MFFGSFAEIFMIFFMSGFSGGGLADSLGLPPGERDAKLIQAAPADSLLFVEWAERAEGKAGGKGIDGLAGDAEVKQFFKDVWKAIETGVAKGTVNGDQTEKTLGATMPPLMKILLSRSGSFWVSFDPSLVKPPKAGQAPPGPQWLMFFGGVKAALVVNGGAEADEIAKHLDQLVKLLPADKRKADLKRQPIPLPDIPLSLTLHRHGKYFILGFGPKAVDTAIAGLDDKSKGLAGNAAFQAAIKQVAYARNASLTYINVKGGIGKAAAIAGEDVSAMVKMLGLESVDLVVSATGVVDGVIQARRYIGTGGKTDGVLALFSGRGIKPADFKHVPADSDLVLSYSVNAKNVLKAVRTIVSAADKVSADRLEQIIKQFEKDLGLKLEEDLLAAFGDVFVLHNSKSAGGFFLTSAVASLEVKDHKKATDAFNKLMDVLEESMPGNRERFGRVRGVSLKAKAFEGHRIYFINTVGDDVPFAPAFCLTKSHLLAAPHPQALKAHLRFVKKGGKSFADRFGKDLQLPKGDVLSTTFVESKEMLRIIYGLAPYFMQVAASELQSGGAEIDIFSLPSARGILPYFSNSFSATVRTEKGIVSESKGVIPGASVMPVMMVMPYFFMARSFERGRAPRAIKQKLNAIPRIRKVRNLALREKRTQRLAP